MTDTSRHAFPRSPRRARRAASRLAAAFALACAAHGAFAAPALPERIEKSRTLTFCSAMDVPPIAYYDENQNATGMSVDVANDIAKQLGGLKVQWRIMQFAGLVPGLLAQQCDAILDQLFDKPERRQVIDIIDYMWASEAVVVPQANPKKIHGLEDLAGLKVAALNGSTIRSLLEAENTKLAAAGKPAMTIVVFNRDSDAFQALRLGQVDAYGTTVETAAYYQKIAQGLFTVAASGFYKIPTGIGLRKNDPELNAALTQAVSDLLKSDRYTKMLQTWGVEADRLSPN